MTRLAFKPFFVWMSYFVCCSVFSAQEYTEVHELTINSLLLGEKREVVVFLPPHYGQSEKNYPVLYLTDGDIQGPHSAGTIDYLSKFDQIPSMIVVGIINPRSKRDRELTLATTKHKKGEQPKDADQFLDFLEQELITFINSNYRTLDYKALSGTSHGGQFAINAWVKRPTLFDGVIAISPTLYWNKKQLLEITEVALLNNRLTGSLFVSIANEEPIMTEPFHTLIDLILRYPNESLLVSSKVFDQEDHNTTVLLGQYYGLKHLFSQWAVPDAPQTLADLQRVYQRRSELLDSLVVLPEDKVNGYGQWMQSLNRQQDALDLFLWNKVTSPQSFDAHQAVIKAYLYFGLMDEAKKTLEDAIKILKSLEPEQIQELDRLFSH